MHGREHRLAGRHKVWLDAGGRFALGDGGTELLRAIETTGSVRAAARSVGWSYRHALAYLDNAERGLRCALFQRHLGLDTAALDGVEALRLYQRIADEGRQGEAFTLEPQKYGT